MFLFFNIISHTPFFRNFLPLLVSPHPRALIYFSFAFWCRVEGSSPSRNLNEEPSPMTARMKEEAYIKATKGEARAPAESTAVRLIGYQSYKGYTNTELENVKTSKNEKTKRRPSGSGMRASAEKLSVQWHHYAVGWCCGGIPLPTGIPGY